jgi:RNA polymerase sigma factor (sigma-70 family)
MTFEPSFNAPDEIVIAGNPLSIKQLREAIVENDMTVIKPLIDQILMDASNQKTDSVAFAFLVVVIRPIIKTAIQREFRTYQDADFGDFFLGALTAIWIKLPQYDPKLSKFSTYVYRQTRDGNRSFTRNSEKFYEACRQFNSNPAMVVQNMAVEYSAKSDDLIYEDTGFAEFEDSDLSQKRLGAIEKVWDNLDERTQAIIKLHFLDNRTPKEVAEIIGPPLNERTVHEYIARATNKLRIAVEKEYKEKEG